MKNNNRIIAILLSLFMGLLGTIPWVLMYVYGNMIIAIMAVFIALAAWIGYSLAKGKVDKYVPIIIIIISLISITIATFIFIPSLLLIKQGETLSIEKIKELYEYQSFLSGILKDYVISIVFTFLGISGVINNMKDQINAGKKIDLMNYTTINENEKKIMYNAFNKLNAFDKNNAKSQDDILSNINDDNKDRLFMKFIYNRIIKSYKGKYYYSKETADNPGKAFFKRLIIIILSIIIVLVVLTIIATHFINEDKNSEIQEENIIYNEVIQNNRVKYLVPNNWVEASVYRNGNVYYYTPEIDKTGYSGIISVRYEDTDYSISDYEELKYAIKKAYEEDKDEDLISINFNEFSNELGYNVIEIIMVFDDDVYPTTEYLYYIVGDNEYGLVYLTDHYSDYVKEPKNIAYNMVKNFDFIKEEVDKYE